jgi:hypothetical protein
MNPIIYVILGIITLVIAYYIFIYFTNTQVLIQKQNLNSTSIPSIPNKSITNSTSTHYAYSVWIFVNNLNNTSDKPTSCNSLFSFEDPTLRNCTGAGDNVIDTSSASDQNAATNVPYFRMYILNRNTATLNVQVGVLNKDGKPTTQTIVITKNFPLQRWTNVIVNVDSNYIDSYMDGKLIQATKITEAKNDLNGTNISIYTPNPLGIIQFGLNQDITLGNLIRYPYSIDPQTAYYAYLQGSGQSSESSSVMIVPYFTLRNT